MMYNCPYKKGGAKRLLEVSRIISTYDRGECMVDQYRCSWIQGLIKPW